MAYEKIGFVKGDILKAEHLNHMEEGIANNVPVKGVDYFDGVSATHSWDGTVLTVTSASGTSSADLVGEKGTTGRRGSYIFPISTAPTPMSGTIGNGYSYTHRIPVDIVDSEANTTVYQHDMLYYLYYRFTVVYRDSSYVYCNNRVSIQGPKGDTGADGYTPVRGVDYWTEADQETIVQETITELKTPDILTNLNIIYSETEPTVIEGGIWLQPMS